LNNIAVTLQLRSARGAPDQLGPHDPNEHRGAHEGNADRAQYHARLAFAAQGIGAAKVAWHPSDLEAAPNVKPKPAAATMLPVMGGTIIRSSL
jgi:hypothetical protein